MNGSAPRVAVLAEGGPGWGAGGPAGARFLDTTLGERALALVREFDPEPLVLCRGEPRGCGGPWRWVRWEPREGDDPGRVIWAAAAAALEAAGGPVILLDLELPLVPRVWVEYLRRLALVHWAGSGRPAGPAGAAAIVPSLNEGVEPGAAVFHPEALPAVAAAAAGAALGAGGVPAGLAVLSIGPGEWREMAGPDCFLRCAGPADLERARRLAGAERGDRLRRGAKHEDPPVATRKTGAASPLRMVDVGPKPVTRRSATAAGRITLGPVAFPLLAAGRLPKGDALLAAQLAAVQAVKRTADAIPLCHPVPVDAVDVTWTTDPAAGMLEVNVTVSAEARTGVEMEALHGAAVFLLTLYDMAKGVDRGLTISALRLLRKSGGRSGEYRRDPDLPGEKELA